MTRLPRVLVVDDCVVTAQSLALLLRVWGHDVELAHDGAAALRAAAAFRPDVVLLDLGLPDTDGLTVARSLRRHESTQAARLIALTGRADDEGARQSLAAGIDDYLVKPVDPAALRARLSQACAAGCP